MINSMWILEYRVRERKNGKWSDWQPMRSESSSQVTYCEYPETELADHDKYQRRAVEYRRVEPKEK